MSNKILCSYCGANITEVVRTKRHYAKAKIPERCYCNRDHRIADDTRTGFFPRLAAAGNAAQAAYKAEHGVVPGYEQRRAALQRPNRTNNRPKSVRSTASQQ